MIRRYFISLKVHKYIVRHNDSHSFHGYSRTSVLWCDGVIRACAKDRRIVDDFIGTKNEFYGRDLTLFYVHYCIFHNKLRIVYFTIMYY